MDWKVLALWFTSVFEEFNEIKSDEIDRWQEQTDNDEHQHALVHFHTLLKNHASKVIVFIQYQYIIAASSNHHLMLIS